MTTRFTNKERRALTASMRRAHQHAAERLATVTNIPAALHVPGRGAYRLTRLEDGVIEVRLHGQLVGTSIEDPKRTTHASIRMSPAEKAAIVSAYGAGWTRRMLEVIMADVSARGHRVPRNWRR